MNLGYFINFLPVKFNKTTVIMAKNASLSDTREEFLRLLGLILLVAMTQGVARKEFWANDVLAMFFGASFHLHVYMSREL
jgi:hypothetical protein